MPDYDETLCLPGTESRATFRYTGSRAELWIDQDLLLTGPRQKLQRVAYALSRRTQTQAAA